MMRRLTLALLLFTWTAVRTAQALPQETWLVAVANNHGDHDEIGLLYAARDAQQFVEALQTQGGIQGRLTTVLLNAKADDVRDTLHDINTRIRERSSKAATALIVFYSGHADADALHLDGTHLRMEELKALVQGSPAALRLLVVDACRSGSVTRVKGVRPAESFQLNMLNDTGAEGLAIITSSAAGEASRESDVLRGSFFTHHLVNALRGAADQNGDGVVTLGEAYAYTYAQTLRSSGRTLDLQHPTYSYDVKGRSDVVLAKPREAAGRVGQLRMEDEAVYLISERAEGGPVVAEIAASRAETTLALPEGAYFVQERRPAEYREYQVQLGAGQQVALSALQYRSVRYDRLVRARGGEKLYVQGLMLLAGGHGSTVTGENASPQVILGYGVDLPWFSAGLRLRGATTSAPGIDDALPRRHTEYGLALALQRFIDLQPFSVSFGLLMEGTAHQQSFTGSRTAPTRTEFGGSFGGILSVERHLVGGLALHLEGGPITELFNQSQTAPDGSATGQLLASPFTWWAAGGLVWHL